MEEEATLAGGCFWCIDSAFLDLEGVISTQAGYSGGEASNPSYEEVCSGKTGHFEVVRLTFDPEKITYLQILDTFWRRIDPTDNGGQFFDRNSQYKTAIFYHNSSQKILAEKSKNAVQELFAEPIATQILPKATFYKAEEYHQKYCKKQPANYENYQKGHIPKLKQLWEDKPPPSALIKEKNEVLTPLQYEVTQKEGTEPPFRNEYFDNKEEGIYVDRITGEPLFISKDKFDSKSGWPSFTRSIDRDKIQEQEDYKLGMCRVEVKSKSSGAHLGHVFPDGPEPSHLRYCINSAAIRFIPKEKLKQEGYEKYLRYFD